MTDYSIKRFHKYSDNELIERLRIYAKSLGVSFVSCEGFSVATGISETTFANHFGSWRDFCERAQLAPRYQRSVSRIELFENLDRVWQTLGHQPRLKEMKQPLSRISCSRYRSPASHVGVELHIDHKTSWPAEARLYWKTFSAFVLTATTVGLTDMTSSVATSG